MLKQTVTEKFTRKDWLGGYRSLTQEMSYWIEEMDGTVPAGLTGTVFRNGPGLLDVGGEPYLHPFDGDGMICRISFVDGRAHFANSYVKTPQYLAEQEAQKILYRGVFGTQKMGGWLANAFDLRRKNIANTNVIYHNGKLLALWEADRPYALDPRTLATIGIEDFANQLPAGKVFTAHPRIDPSSGDIWAFGVEPGLRSKISIYCLKPSGELQIVSETRVQGFCFLHDFVWTEEYAIFIQNPIQFNPLPFVLGWQTAGACIALKPNTPSQILLIDRQGRTRTYVTEACFVFHHGNAYKQDGHLILDAVTYPDYPKLEANSDFREVDFTKVIPGQLSRFVLDLDTGTVQRRTLFPYSCEFPSLHPRCVGRPHRYLYLATIAEACRADGNAPLQAIAKIDTETAEVQIYSFAPRGFVGEPLFIPCEADLHSPEDRGWLITMVYNAERSCSDVVILNAQDMSHQATLHLKHHVPYGLHGSFVRQTFLD
jgi:all-trans-8'-apo-beta-carotenal 15,15'-oxygenase